MTESEIRRELDRIEDEAQLNMNRRAVPGNAEADEKRLADEFEGLVARRRELREELAAVRSDPDGAVFREVAPATRLSAYLRAAAGSEQLRGAEAELHEELFRDHAPPAPGGAWVPWCSLASREQRADNFGAVPTAATGDRITWIDRVFAATAAMFCNVRMVDVPPGVSEHVVVNQSNEDPALVARGSQHDSHGFGMSLTSLTPTRLSAAYGFAQEDLMRVGPEMESAIRRDLTGAIGETLDAMVLAGSGTAPQWTGLQNSGTAPTAASGADTWDEVIQAVGGGLDGRFAKDLPEVRLLVGTAMAPYLARLLRSGNAADQTAWEWIGSHAGGIMTSAVSKAATDSNKAEEGLLVRTGAGPNAVCAHWGGGIQVIRDEQSADLVGRGRVRLTMNLYCDFAVLRSAGYVRTAHRNAT